MKIFLLTFNVPRLSNPKMMRTTVKLQYYRRNITFLLLNTPKLPLNSLLFVLFHSVVTFITDSYKENEGCVEITVCGNQHHVTNAFE